MDPLSVNPTGIPAELKAIPNWVLWWETTRDGKLTKIPYTPDGKRPAKTDDPSTWGTFEAVLAKYREAKFSGIGFCFTDECDVTGIDLDMCRDPRTGDIANWALPTLNRFDSYCEISPSGCGVKMFLLGRLPTDMTGAKTKAGMFGTSANGGKQPGIECYCRGRFFCVTGHWLPDFPNRLVSYNGELQEWYAEVFGKPSQSGPTVKVPEDVGGPSLLDRAKAYLRKLPPAVAGQRGHDQTFHVACVLRCDFGLTFAEAWEAIQDWNQTCDPPWSPDELRDKLEDAGKQPVTNRLRGDRPGTTANPSQKQFEILTAAELAAGDFSSRYIVDDILAAMEFCILVGPKKSLKTTLALYVAACVAVGRALFGIFNVPQRLRVGFFSGESGRGTLQDAMRRVAGYLGRSPGDFENLVFCFDVPRLDSPAEVATLEKIIRERGLQLVCLDCFYRMLGPASDDVANLFKMGSLLASLMDVQQRAGCTIVLLHHTRMHAGHEEPDLNDAAFAGIGEAARQWVLLKRRRRYDPAEAGHHELWFSTGGSMGHSELLALNIDEGSRKDPGGRRFDLEILSAEEARTENRNADDSDRTQRRADDSQHVLKIMAKFPDGETKTAIRDASGLNSNRFGPALADLLTSGEIEPCSFHKHTRTENGYRLVGTGRDRSGSPACPDLD